MHLVSLKITLLLLAAALLGASSPYCRAAGDRGPAVDTNVIYPPGALVQNGGRVIDITNPPATYSGSATGILTATNGKDCTAAIRSDYDFIKNQQLLPDGTLQYASPNSFIIYIPNGTYYVSKPLIYNGPLLTGTEGSPDIVNVHIIGQSRAGTVIQLLNTSGSFQSTSSPMPVVCFQHPSGTTMNVAQTLNDCENFTVNTGTGNPGAAGIYFEAANGGRMSNVSVISGDGKGAFGIWLKVGANQDYFKDITVSGFNYAVSMYENGGISSFEHLTCTNQKKAAIDLIGGGVPIRDMVSTQVSSTVPAIQYSGASGYCALLDSQLNGPSNSATDAIVLTDTEQCLFVRNTSVAGYPAAVEDRGTPSITGSFISEGTISGTATTTGSGITLFTPQDAHSFALAVEDTPIVLTDTNMAHWVNVEDFRNGSNTDTATVQAAFAAASSSNATTVYFPHMAYNLTATCTIPACVTRVDFMFNTINGGSFYVSGSSANPILMVGHMGPTYTWITGPRTLVYELCWGGLADEQSAPIKTFTECSTAWCTANQQVWAREPDVETPAPGVDMQATGTNTSLWIFGAKTEDKPLSSTGASNHGVVEVLGCQVNMTSGTAEMGTVPMITNSNSSISYTGFTTCFGLYPVAIAETRAGVTGTLTGSPSPGYFWSTYPTGGVYPTEDFFVPLYVGGPRPSGPLGQFQQNQDIGAVAAAGSTINYDGATATYFIDASGVDISGTADSFQFASSTWTGNATLIAHVNSVDNTNAAAKAGVMFRSSTNANAMFVDVVATPSQGISMQMRTSVGASATSAGVNAALAPPCWVMLQRTGTGTFVGSVSPDGASWTQLGAATVNLSSTAYAGLCVTAHNNNSNGTLCRSIMSDVALLPAAPSSLSATSGSSQIGLTWTASFGATAYNIYRATSSAGPYTLIATSTSAAFTDTSVTDTTAYWYVVTALDAGGETLDSNQVTTTVILPPLQQWRLSNFGILNPADPVAGNTADPTGYGIPNLMRYALGLPIGGAPISGLPYLGQSAGYLTLTFTRLKADTDITYHVQACGDLKSWSDVWTSGTVPYGGGINPQQTVIVSDTVPITTAPGAKRFLHLEVTNP